MSGLEREWLCVTTLQALVVEWKGLSSHSHAHAPGTGVEKNHL